MLRMQRRRCVSTVRALHVRTQSSVAREVLMHARSVPSLAEAAGQHGFRAAPLLLRPAEHGVFAVFPQDRFISAGLGGAGRWHATMVPTRATHQSREAMGGGTELSVR